ALSAPAPVLLPADAVLADAGDQMHFQTIRDVHVTPAQMTAVWTGAQTRAADVTSANEPGGRTYFPFGIDPQRNRALYLAFDAPFGIGLEEISLYVWTASWQQDRETRA